MAFGEVDVHLTAIIGHPPEHRDWKRGDPIHRPHLHDLCRIGALTSVDSGMHQPTIIGARTWAMKHCHVGHDAIIGEDCELAPGTVIGGHVTIGNNVRFGINSCVRPYITIGDGARIGAGAVVIKDVPAGQTWVGNPARPL